MFVAPDGDCKYAFRMLLLSLLVAATEFDNFHFLGFTPDNARAAYATLQEKESGEVFSTCSLFEVKSGKELSALSAPNADDCATQLLRTARVKVFEAGEEKALKPSQKNADVAEIEGRNRETLGNIMLIAHTTNGGCPQPGRGMRALRLQVELALVGDNENFRLAEEKSVPKERPCASSCAIRHVYARDKSTVAMVLCLGNGAGATWTPMSGTTELAIDPK